MGTALHQPPARHAPTGTAPAESPNADWEERCEAAGYTRWPHGLRALLFRATSGHATAIAICEVIVERTHGAVARRGGSRPEWTGPLTTEDFAELLGISVRTIQDAVSFLIERGFIGSRPAPNRARCYQVRPRQWELFEARGRKDAEAEVPNTPPNGRSVENARVVRIVDEPLLLLPGKASRPIRISDAIVARLRNVRCQNDTGVDLRFDPYLDDGDLCIHLFTPGANTVNKQRTLAQNPAPGGVRPTGSTTGSSASDYREYLAPLLLDQFRKSLDQPFLTSIVAKANGAPVSLFAAIVEGRLKRGGKHSTGLLLELAKDAAKSHKAMAELEAAREAAAQGAKARYDARERAETIALLKRLKAEEPEEFEYYSRNLPELVAMLDEESPSAPSRHKS